MPADLARAFTLAAIAADRWPPGHAKHWGQNDAGEWVYSDSQVTRCPCPALVWARTLNVYPWYAYIALRSACGAKGAFHRTLDTDPRQIGRMLRDPVRQRRAVRVWRWCERKWAGRIDWPRPPKGTIA